MKPDGAYVELDVAFGVPNSGAEGTKCNWFVTEAFYNAVESIRGLAENERQGLLYGLVVQGQESLRGDPKDGRPENERSGLLVASDKDFRGATLKPIAMRVKITFEGPKTNPDWVLIDGSRAIPEGPWKPVPRPPQAFKNLVEAYAVEETTKDGPPCPYWVDEKFYDTLGPLREGQELGDRHSEFTNCIMSMIGGVQRDAKPEDHEWGDDHSGGMRRVFFSLSVVDPIGRMPPWQHASPVTMTYGENWTLLTMDKAPVLPGQEPQPNIDALGVSGN